MINLIYWILNKKYLIKGFNSNLMVNSELYSKILDVNFEELCTAYLIPYDIDTDEEYPVYITLGYLLAFLNKKSANLHL